MSTDCQLDAHSQVPSLQLYRVGNLAMGLLGVCACTLTIDYLQVQILRNPLKMTAHLSTI